MARFQPLLLIILDGFGISLSREGNPLAVAHLPTFNEIEKNFPFTTIQASGTAVGLPWGEAGNSEVGHLTMGTGRVIEHHLPRIINAIRDGSFFKNETLLKVADHVRTHNSHLHVAGLISSGSVHAYIDHLYALFEFTKQQNLDPVYLHPFSDGKDAPPTEAAQFYQELEVRLARDYPNVKIATVCGRFFGLDREEQWDRTQKAYELLTEGKGEVITSIADYYRTSYQEGTTDEFIKPAILSDESGSPRGLIRDNDALLFADFREDSMRQITHAFFDKEFKYFPRKKRENLLVATMTEYQTGLALPAFPKLDIAWPLSRVLSDAGLKQLHIAETQKYAHVTYFFNGGIETPFPHEDRILIPSLPTTHFDEAPEMRSREITEKIIENFDRYDVIIANFANADMVGHTGNFDAAIKAAEIVDTCLKKILEVVLSRPNSIALITADHGNIELKRNVLTGEKLTEHSTSPVPLYLVGQMSKRNEPSSPGHIEEQKKEVHGILTDIAPTLIDLLGLSKPVEMIGHSLLPLLKGGIQGMT